MAPPMGKTAPRYSPLGRKCSWLLAEICPESPLDFVFCRVTETGVRIECPFDIYFSTEISYNIYIVKFHFLMEKKLYHKLVIYKYFRRKLGYNKQRYILHRVLETTYFDKGLSIKDVRLKSGFSDNFAA